MATRVRSYSKINLGLAVGPARADGFHGLATVYQTLALHDFVTVTVSPAKETYIWIVSNHPGVPQTSKGDAEKNTAWKIVHGALRRMGVTAEVTVVIDKRLPVQGGMGAGSANAVAALLGLERELANQGIPALPEPERMELAAAVGSDVPLFLLGGTVFGTGRGEEVYPLPEVSEDAGIPCVVALPAVGVSTALAFQELDKRQVLLTSGAAADRLKELSYAIAAVWMNVYQTGAEAGPSGITRADAVDELKMLKQNGLKIKLGSDLAQRGDLAETPGFAVVNPLLALVRTGIENDFEEVAFSQHPSLRSIKRDLLGSSAGTSGSEGALYACLSGSGSALFGLYASQAAASEAQQRVQGNGTRAIVTETLARDRYWQAMFE
jgi:4-diphosphocytidyl-2-C-methyl-D-erythritol kinase